MTNVKKTIALLMVALMALTVLSTAGIAAADYGRNNNNDNNKVIKVPLALEKRDEQHKWIGWVWLKKANKDDRGMNDRGMNNRDNDVFWATIWVNRKVDIDQGKFALNAEKKIRDDRSNSNDRFNRDDRFTRDVTLKKIDIDRWTTFPLKIWVKVPRDALKDPDNLVLELQKVRSDDRGFDNTGEL